MLSTLKQLILPDSLEAIDEQLNEVRQDIQTARDTVATAIDAPAIAESMSALDALCKTQLRLEARRDLVRRKALEAVAKQKADAKRKVDEASQSAIADLKTCAVEHVDPMLAQVETVIRTFLDRRNQVLATAAAARNNEALHRGQDSTNVLRYFLQMNILRLTGVRSTSDPTQNRTFASYMPGQKGEKP
jgi:hypothetical protein